MMSKSSSSRRLLVFHGSSPHQSRLEKTGLSSIQKQSQATASCFNLEDLNDTKLLGKRSEQEDRLVREMRAQLTAKEDMLEFYRGEQRRRKDRFEKQLKSREETLTETLNNLRNLLNIETEKNSKIEKKIEALKNTESRGQPQNSSILGYSDYEISRSELVRKDQTILLDEMSSSLTLTQYL